MFRWIRKNLDQAIDRRHKQEAMPDHIAQIVSSNCAILDELRKRLPLVDAGSRSAAAVEYAAEDIRNMVKMMRGEPFAALQTWIGNAIEQEKRAHALNEELLARWKSHTESLEARIAELEAERKQTSSLRKVMGW